MKITKRQLRRIIREAAKDYSTMAYDYKMWAKHEFRASHLEPNVLAAYARGLGLTDDDVEELAVTIGMPPEDALELMPEARVRQIIREAMVPTYPEGPLETLPPLNDVDPGDYTPDPDYLDGYDDAVIGKGYRDNASDAYLDGYRDGVESVEAQYASMGSTRMYENAAAGEIIALAFRPNYDRGYRVIRVEVDDRTADATQGRGDVVARYEASIEDMADMVAEDFPGETIRLDAAGYTYGGAKLDPRAAKLARALRGLGVKVVG